MKVVNSIGILSNPRSGRIKNNISVIRELSGSIDGGIYREASNDEEFQSVLAEFAEKQVTMLVIIAGDGTVHAVLTYIFSRQAFASLPTIAIIPAGTTNMTAKDFEITGKPARVLSDLMRVLKNDRPLSCINRSVLGIRNGEDTPRYGMFFGTGIIADGVDYFQKHIRGLGITGERASALVLLRYLFRLLSGREQTEHENSMMLVGRNDDAGKMENTMLLFATSLNRLLLGMRPYWGTEAEAIHFTLVRKSPAKLWRRLLPLIRGKGAVLLETDGYSSKNLSELSIKMQGSFIIDGELYQAKENDFIYINASNMISVVDLRY